MNTLITLPKILFFPIINIVILFIFGFGLTQLILPKKIKQYFLWLSPWMTIIVSIFVLVIVSLLGLSVKQIIWPLIAVFLGIDLYVLFKIKPRVSINIKEDFLLACFVLMSLVLNLSPLIRRDRIMTTISLGNNDVISYTTTGDYLKNNSISKSFKEKVEISTGVLLNDGYRWGAPMINSFFLTIFNFDGYQYTYISQVILFSLFIPLCYILFKILFVPNIVSLVMISIFTGFNVNLLYILYHNFFGQVLFWGIGTLLFIFFYSYLFSKEINSKKFNLYDYNIGILITVLYFSYLEPAVFMFAPLGLFLFINWIFSRKKIYIYTKALIRIALVAFITGSISIIRATVLAFQQAFMGNPNQPIGWQLFRSKIPYANPFEAMGFWSIHNFEPLPTILAIILSIIIMLIIIKGILKSRNKILTISYVFIFSIFYYWTAISQHNFFSYNRVLTYTLPFIVVLFSIGLTSLYEKQKYFWSIIIVILISLELWSAVNLNKRFIREHLSVEKSFISILNLKDKNIKEPIYEEGFINERIPLWKRIWIGYFLYSQGTSITPTVFNSEPFENLVPDNSLILLSKPNPWLPPPKIILKDTVWSNDYFQLGHICNSDKCLLKSTEDLSNIVVGKNDYEDSLFISGWEISEGESRWANSKETTMRLVVKDDNFSKLIIEASSLKEPQELTAYIDDIFIGKISVKTAWQNYSLPVDMGIVRGVHKIRFVFSQGYTPSSIIPGNLDNRILYVNFRKISLE